MNTSTRRWHGVRRIAVPAIAALAIGLVTVPASSTIVAGTSWDNSTNPGASLAYVGPTWNGPTWNGPTWNGPS
jgi:hypothetical protein